MSKPLGPGAMEVARASSVRLRRMPSFLTALVKYTCTACTSSSTAVLSPCRRAPTTRNHVRCTFYRTRFIHYFDGSKLGIRNPAASLLCLTGRAHSVSSWIVSWLANRGLVWIINSRPLCRTMLCVLKNAMGSFSGTQVNKLNNS